MRKLCLLSFMAIVINTIAQEQISANGTWNFFHAKSSEQADSMVTHGFGNQDFDASTFVPIPVPSNWAILGFEEPIYRGFKDNKASEGLYLKNIDIPISFDKKRVLLHFGGVWNSAEVWLNGIWIGKHDSGYTSFSFDVSQAIKAGKKNILAVRVRQVYPGYKTDTYDDWTLGGIYRDVTFESVPAKRRIDRVRVQTKMNGELSVKVMVADEHKNTRPGNYIGTGNPYSLKINLLSPQKNIIYEKVINVKAHPANSRETHIPIKVEHPMLWSAETPHLYTLNIDLIENNKIVHTNKQKIGIREITTDRGVFRINGQAVKLRGVNLHDEWPNVGRATTHKHWLKDIKLMKAANINYIRASHYQHAKGFIELCDSIGMYVGSEISLGGAGNLMYNPAFTAGAILRTIETIERDLNNPSIIYWSIGNEDSLTDLFMKCIRTAKGLDPTRPILLPWNADETLPEEIDILAPHYWTAHEYDSIANQSNRPIITTEYVHAYGEMRFGGLEDCWKELRNHKATAGGAVWMWADQGIRTPNPKDKKRYNTLAINDDYLRLDAAGWDGIVDSDRNTTRDYYEVKSVYAPIYPISQSIPLKTNLSIPIQNDYDFLDSEGISIDYKIFIDERIIKIGSGRVNIPPHSQGNLNIPNIDIESLYEDETAYIQLSFKDSTGQEIVQKSVELTTSKIKKRTKNNFHISVSENEKEIRIEIGNRNWVINRKTGMPENIRPTIWHLLNEGESIIKRTTDFNGEIYQYKVNSINITTIKNAVIVTSDVTNTINANDSIKGIYSFIFDKTGNMTISYKITPCITTTFIPIVGMAMKTEPLRWLGLGPEDAYPNKKAAPILGVYSAQNICGIKSTKWIEVTDARIQVNGYIDHGPTETNEIRILSHVLGRPEKGRLNDINYQLLPNKTYKGSFKICYKR